MRFIYLGGLWFVHRPISCMIQIQFLAQFPVDHLSGTLVSIFVLIIIPLEFFTSVLADGFSLEFE